MGRSLGFLIERRRGAGWDLCSVDALLAKRAFTRLSHVGYAPASPVYTVSPASELIAVLLGDAVRPPLGEPGLPVDLSEEARREVATMAEPAYGEPGHVLAAELIAHDWTAENEDGEPSQDLQDLAANLRGVLGPLTESEQLRIVYFFS